MLGAYITWFTFPFGPILKNFWPVEDFFCSAGVKLEEDNENGQTRVIGRTPQTCGFAIRISRETGSNPRLVFEALDKVKELGISAPIFIAHGYSASLANSLLDKLQTSDWTKIVSVEGALELGTSLLLGSKLGGVSFMLTAVELDSEILGPDGDLKEARIYLSFTEDSPQRQPGGLKVLINEKDITDSISVTDCVYEMRASGQANSLRIKFADTKKQWVGWSPKETDTIRITDGVINSGRLYIESMKPQDGQYSINAFSVPKKAFNKRSRSFENIPLSQLARKIAGEHNLSVETYGLTDTNFPYIQQRNQSDLAFLAERCQLAGAAFMIFDQKLCLYDERTIENRDPTKTLTLGSSVEATFTDDANTAYSTAQVTNASNTGQASDSNVTTGKTYIEKVTEYVASGSDMNKLTQAILRRVNKGKKTGEIYMSTQRELAAGSVIRIVANGWIGPAFIYRCRHDLKNKKTRFWIRQPLNY